MEGVKLTVIGFSTVQLTISHTMENKKKPKKKNNESTNKQRIHK